MTEENRLKEEAIKQLEWIKPKKPWSKDSVNYPPSKGSGLHPLT